MKKKRALSLLKKSDATAANLYHSSLWSVRLPAIASPLNREDDLRISTPAQHAMFLRCCELYRIIDLNVRSLPELIEVYSKFRTRDHFKESFTFRHFDADLSALAQCDADLVLHQNVLFNILHELKISLSYTDALPHTIRTEIERVVHVAAKAWNDHRDILQQRYGWDFKRIEA